MKNWDTEKLGTAIVGGGLTLLGLFMSIDTAMMPKGPGYAVVGPRAFPTVIGFALIVVGLLHVRLALRLRPKAAAEATKYDVAALAWVIGSLVVQIGIMRWVGWIPAATLTFMGVARAFGSRKPGRDAPLGFALACGTFALFNLALGLNLPVGELLEPLLPK